MDSISDDTSVMNFEDNLCVFAAINIDAAAATTAASIALFQCFVSMLTKYPTRASIFLKVTTL